VTGKSKALIFYFWHSFEKNHYICIFMNWNLACRTPCWTLLPYAAWYVANKSFSCQAGHEFLLCFIPYLNKASFCETDYGTPFVCILYLITFSSVEIIGEGGCIMSDSFLVLDMPLFPLLTKISWAWENSCLTEGSGP
jgi:hypothetical protein